MVHLYCLPGCGKHFILLLPLPHMPSSSIVVCVCPCLLPPPCLPYAPPHTVLLFSSPSPLLVGLVGLLLPCSGSSLFLHTYHIPATLLTCPVPLLPAAYHAFLEIFRSHSWIPFDDDGWSAFHSRIDAFISCSLCDGGDGLDACIPFFFPSSIDYSIMESSLGRVCM